MTFRNEALFKRLQDFLADVDRSRATTAVRAAQLAAFGLLGIDKQATPMYDGARDAGVLTRSIQELLS
jgi:myosin-crossreactive antigen